MSDRLNSHPKWINPCGGSIKSAPDDSNINNLETASPDMIPLSDIIRQTTIALSKASQFKEDYVKNTFQMDFNNFHELWKKKRYDWLPTNQEIPKNLGEKLDPNGEHLQSIQLKDVLVDVYEYLQKIAVGLEQVVWDQEDFGGDFKKEFTDLDFGMRQVLCEIHDVMAYMGVSQREDVTREHMTKEFREMDTTSMNFRDWLIYRDYMNALEYTIQVFSHIKSTL